MLNDFKLKLDILNIMIFEILFKPCNLAGFFSQYFGRRRRWLGATDGCKSPVSPSSLLTPNGGNSLLLLGGCEFWLPLDLHTYLFGYWLQGVGVIYYCFLFNLHWQHGERWPHQLHYASSDTMPSGRRRSVLLLLDGCGNPGSAYGV